MDAVVIPIRPPMVSRTRTSTVSATQQRKWVGECVLCYVQSQLLIAPCDHTTRWMRRWARNRPTGGGNCARSTGFERVSCDCELFSVLWECPGSPDGLAPRAPDGRCAGSPNSAPCAHWAPRPPGGAA